MNNQKYDQHIISSMVFPPIEHFASILFDKSIIIDQHEHYKKRSSRNRFTILSPNGPQCLSIPLKKGKNEKTAMKDVLISYDMPWMNKYLRAIQTAYGSAPFFPYYFDDISLIFNENHNKLVDFNHHVIKTLAHLLNVEENIKFTTEYIEHTTDNIKFTRDIFHPVKVASISKDILPHSYVQVFSDRFEFMPNLSILDLIFCLGPESVPYLKNSTT